LPFEVISFGGGGGSFRHGAFVRGERLIQTLHLRGGVYLIVSVYSIICDNVTTRIKAIEQYFPVVKFVKDGASFCHCAYVLRISGYWDFLRNLPTNTTIFLRGL